MGPIEERVRANLLLLQDAEVWLQLAIKYETQNPGLYPPQLVEAVRKALEDVGNIREEAASVLTQARRQGVSDV